MARQNNTPSTDPPQGDERPHTLIGRISRQTLAGMEAETARFMADYIPRVEREANRDRLTDVALFKDLALHHFNLTAREVLAVCKSVEEFEAALLNEIPRFVHFSLGHYPFLAEPIQEEMSSGFAFYCLRANPWTQIPDEDREEVWHVGAITGEALSHAALKWRAEAWRLAAEGKLTNGQPGNEPEAESATEDGASGPDGWQPGARAAFVKPKLDSKGWSVLDWANECGVDFHTASDFLKDKTNPYRSTRKKLAEGLGVAVEELPK